MPVTLSILIPVYNEQENVEPLAREISQAFAGHSVEFEIVMVDDSSTDGTWKAVERAHQTDSRVRGVRHQQNRGQSAAVWTGIQNSSSAILATLDGDRQNDPADLPKLLEELKHCDFACGWRQKREDSLIRKFSSRVAWVARKAMLKSSFQDTGCALRVFKRTALEGVFPFNGLHRFLPIIVEGNGFVVREIPVQHRARVAGVSKYGVWNRVWRGIYDLFALAWYQRRRLKPVEVIHLPPKS